MPTARIKHSECSYITAYLSDVIILGRLLTLKVIDRDGLKVLTYVCILRAKMEEDSSEPEMSGGRAVCKRKERDWLRGEASHGEPL